MNVTLAVLADFANKSVDGKLNILGVFDTIYAESYPAVHPEMKLVIRFEMHPAETEEAKKVQIQLRNDRGAKLSEVAADLQVQVPPGVRGAGEMVTADIILSLAGLPIDQPGTYEFVVLVSGEVKRTVPFKAMQRPRA